MELHEAPALYEKVIHYNEAKELQVRLTINTFRGIEYLHVRKYYLDFTEDSIDEIASLAFLINQEVENIGARRLHTVMSHLLNDFLFEVPDLIGPNSKILITKEMVQERLSTLVKNRDLSQYIL